MARWSDNKIRSDRYQGSELYRAIRKWCGEQLEERLLEARWDVEALREEKLKSIPKVMAQSAGRS